MRSSPPVERNRVDEVNFSGRCNILIRLPTFCNRWRKTAKCSRAASHRYKESYSSRCFKWRHALCLHHYQLDALSPKSSSNHIFSGLKFAPFQAEDKCRSHKMWQEKRKACQSGIGVGASFLEAGRMTGQTFRRLRHSQLEWANNCTPDTCDQPHVNTDSAGVSWGDKRCCFCFPYSRERSKFVCMLNTFTVAAVGNDFHC